MLKAKYYCDFCGEEIKEKHYISINFYQDMTLLNYDVCHKCGNEIRNYLDKKKNSWKSGENL